MAQLALAWVARIPTTSTVILGASKPEQVVENLKALDVIPKLTPTILDEIEQILSNKPAPEVSFARTSLRSVLLIVLLSRYSYVLLWTSSADFEFGNSRDICMVR